MDCKARLTFLGTGTSTGLPKVGCHCHVCTSAAPEDRRTRASAFLRVTNAAGRETALLIDCGPDIRQQGLRAKIDAIDGVALTHGHNDHVAGIDELRAFSVDSPEPIPLYCDRETEAVLRRRFGYIWDPNAVVGGGLPSLELVHVEPFVPFAARRVSDCLAEKGAELGPELVVTPIRVWHGPERTQEIVGFIFGSDLLCYITDCKTLPEESLWAIVEKHPKVLVINGLRKTPQVSHQTIGEAVKIAKMVNPPMGTYLTHFCHELTHAEMLELVPENVFLAVDGLEIELEGRLE